MKIAALTIPASLLVLVTSALAQCKWPELNPIPQNSNFAASPVGTAPKRWLFGPEWFMPPHLPVYEALVAPTNQCHGSQQCAIVRSLRIEPTEPLPFLYQDLDATLYRGQALTYRASVRVAPDLRGVARLLVRVHRKDCSTTFRDDMGDHPVVSSDWTTYEIRAPIPTDAYHIEFGVQLVGRGAVWIDQISMKFASTQ